MGRLAAVLLVGLVAAAPARAAAPASCPDPGNGDFPGPFSATEPPITGEFTAAQQGSFFMLPFEVTAGTTQIRLRYCYDQPDSPTANLPQVAVRHTIDLGLYEPRPARQRLWTMDEYRGWSGSNITDVTLSPQGFSDDLTAKPQPGRTTRGYRPGPIPPGTWAVELGAAAVVNQSQGDFDGKVAWRVEIALSSDPALATPAYEPAPYDASPARPQPGWYSGDFHVHSSFSGDARSASLQKVGDYAFRSVAAGGGGLDFVQLTDHNTDSAWAEIGRVQGRYPGKLIARNEEITTYRGHVNSPGIGSIVDYRTGALLERRPDGSFEQLRPPRPVSALFDETHERGGLTTVNHPTIFPATIPPFGIICRGCSWEYMDAETDYSRVDAVEVATGPQGLKTEPYPGPNPFSVLAVDFYEHALDRAGRRIAAVSGSDNHRGGESDVADVTGTTIGSPATVVYANELSEEGVRDAVRAGHTYVKYFGHASPDLRLEATPLEGRTPSGIFGDTVYSDRARFEARVIGQGAGPEPMVLQIFRDRQLMSAVPVGSGDVRHVFEASRPGRYRLQLMRGTAIEGLATPVYLEPLANAPRGRPPTARGFARRRIRVRRGRFGVACEAGGSEIRSCRVVARYRPRGRRARTIGAGSVRMSEGAARVALRLNRQGRAALRRRGRVPVTLAFTVEDAAGRTAVARRRATLR
jgi:hypothetical protein